jgi:hypothetical protein
VDLQGQMVTAGEYMIDAGATMKVDGVRFSCSADGMDCTVTVDADGEATWSGAEAMAHLLDSTGYQALANLATALASTAADADGVQSVLNELKANRYDDEADVTANPGATPPVEAVDNGGGVTTSLTTHNQPGSPGTADPLTGVSDIFVTVAPDVMRADEEHDEIVLQVVDAEAGNDEDLTDDISTGDDGFADAYDQERDPATVMNPVLADGSSARTANFDVNATWDLNPAAQWMSEFEESTPTDDFWTHSLETADEGMMLAGGRRLHLDLRSDFNPNAMARGTALVVATGPNYPTEGVGGVNAVAGIPADWMNVEFEGMDDVDLDRERDLTTDATEGLPGSYMGVKGVFVCADGQTGTDAGAGICRINQHSSGEMGVSEGDRVDFIPYMYTADTDWLAAGVWVTIPEDEERGDYAIGAFAYGNNPYKAATEQNAQAIEGTAMYVGRAFGFFAENDAGNKEVGGFEAAAMLTAEFDVDTADIGTINGSLTGFVANEQSVDWAVNFEQADIVMGMTDDDTPVVIDDSALRFNAGASGHGAGGHAVAGYWNGQFYGGSADGDNQPQPGSVAGTFGVTDTDGDADGYTLTLGGAFAAHKEAAGN